MDAVQSPEFPGPETTDNVDVRTALETAAQLWGAASHAEGLRWLRRAAESAADAGDDMRSLALARRAADLRDFAQVAGSVPPPGGSVPAQAHTASPAPEVPAIPEFSNPAQTVPATPAAGAGAALQAASNAARAAGADTAAPAPSQPAPSRPMPSQSRESAVPAPVKLDSDPTNGATPVEGIAAFGAGLAKDSRPAEASVVHSVASISEPPPSFGTGFQTHHSVRIALGPKPNADGQFSVHPLAEGEPVDQGWTEALLVALVPGRRLFPGRE